MPEDSKLAKRKARADKIDWEELERAPNMKGMLSYLTPSHTEGVGRETRSSESLPSEPLTRESLSGAELPVTASGGTAAALAPERSSGDPSAATTPSDLLGDPLFRETPTTVVPGFGKRRFHRCLRVEDAHTAGEQLLLETLYRLAQDPRWGKVEPDHNWLVTISMEELSRQVRLHRTNVRANLNKLRDKLAIDLVAFEDVREQSSRTYRIFPPSQILARRRQAGMEWVVKNRSISFVPDEMVADAIRHETPKARSTMPRPS